MNFTKPIDDDYAMLRKTKTKMIRQEVDTLYRPLSLNYRDPFLNTTIKAPEINIFEKNPEPKIIQWPNIVFKGYVANGNTQLVILEIDGKNSFVNPQVPEKDLKVLAIWNDSICIQKENENKTFYKYPNNKQNE